MGARGLRLEDRLRQQIRLQGLVDKCGVVATPGGAVTVVAAADVLSDDECARLLQAWSTSVVRVG